ncbi:MAG: hypothetical protein AAGF12_10385 [Myxococcota bacterium]
MLQLTLRFFCFLGLCFVMVGCQPEDVPIGSQDSGTDGRADGGGIPCGPNTCFGDEVCCNASCGTCVAPTESCTAIACVPDGGADAGKDATSCVDCAAPPLGCRYEGGSCLTCGELVCDESCGGLLGGACDPDEYCDYPLNTCGITDESGTCQKIDPDAICDRSCPGVCGCDGQTYCNECLAAQAGTDVSANGSCGSCAPQNVTINGDCDLALGIYWDGRTCELRSGCDCRGPDCGNAYRTIRDCLNAHRGCPMGAVCGTIAGLTCGPDEWCDLDCSISDAAGTCQPRPTICTDDCPGVCGCDGRTYCNSCDAQAAGVAVANAMGPCSSRR